MAQSTWQVIIKKDVGNCDLPRRAVEPFLVSGADKCDAACEAGNWLLRQKRISESLHRLGVNLSTGVPYYHDYTVYLENLGPKRPGVYAS